MANHAFPYSLTTLAAAIAGALLSSAAAADTTLYCPAANGMISCTYTGTNYSEPVGIMRNNTGSAYSAPMYVTTNFDVNATIVPESQAGLWIEAMAGTGTANSANDGNNADGLTPNTSGNITLTGGDIVTNGAIYGLLAKMNGGNATSSDGGDVGGNGGVAGAQEILYLANQANIDMTGLAQTQIQGGAGIAVLSKGGNGSSTNDDHNPSGAGGYSSGSRLKNVGQVSATVQGSTRFSGLQAASNGGEGATQYDGGANSGGDSGDVSLQNSGNIVVDWTWRNGNTASNSNAAVYGILAESHGGNGGDTTTNGLGNGGAGGYASSAVITLETGGSVSVTQRGTPPNTVQGTQIFPGAGVAAILLGGDGGNGYADEDQTSGGNAGDAGTIGSSSAYLQINNTDTSVSTSGDPSAGSFSPSGDKLPALLLWAKGGDGGGLFNDDPHYSRRDGGDGGKAGDASLTVIAQNAAIKLSTNGNYSSGIQTLQQGGTGGAGGQYNGDTFGIGDTHPSGIGGAGGQVGSSTISLTGTSALPITITTLGQESHGIYASLLGGDGGAGGIYDVNAGGQIAGTAGAGGSTGNMKITLKGTSISTAGSQAFGILAQSRGANGGDGGEATGDDVTGGAGGSGGSTGTVDVSLDANSSISTQGQSAIGVLAQTASGAGGDGGGATGAGSSTGGAGGSGGNSGNITVNNAGKITTRGVDAIGILAQSVTGAGGAGADSYGILDSSGGSGGSAGVTGNITVSNSGQISTSGDMAIGVVLQSIGGSGGTGGTAGALLVALGGSSASNTLRSDGSSVRINGSASGSVTTSGAGAIGILAQSIGGGGGVGGGSEGAVSIGATGGEGGSGAVATADLDSFLISTGGMNAHGLVIQSIGGGGGNAGNAGSLGVFASVAIGQTGGSGGSGGPVTANLSNSQIVTQGSKAAGVVAQSIGGGGGAGGRAFATSVGVGADGDVAIGGSGGSGGNGGQIGSQLVGSYIATGQATQLTTGACSGTCLPLNQLPVDAFGVVIQSIGGGGGLGGNASSSAIATGLDVSEDAQIALSMTASIGGSGKIGGNGDYVTFAASDGTQITTSGQGSHGVLIQSIGGGGGAGGDSSAMAAAVDSGDTASLSVEGSFALGGTGGAGGHGSSVWAAVGGLINVSGGVATFTADSSGMSPSNITTYGDYANGITAQSIGGGGGNAGFGSATTHSFGSGTNLAPTVSLGGSGGNGGSGGLVQVEVMPLGEVQTWGSGAIGVLAQSIGGGGGASQGGSFTISGTTSAKTGGMTLTLGNDGAAGNVGGSVVVDVAGQIATHGGDAPGVQAQSIGGGGGQGGSAGSDASADNPIIAAEEARSATSYVASQLAKVLADEDPSAPSPVFQANVTIGGTGGSGNTGGSVGVTMDSPASITTGGDWSTGIFAQSVGGGGGKGGNALATGTGWVDPGKFRLSAELALGGDGGTGGDGGAVTVKLGGGSISTKGFGAAGVLAQSVGGGGGHGADGSDGYIGSVTLGMSEGGSAGPGGAGGTVDVSVDNSPVTVTTSGEAAFGIMLQSVGGGGGFAGVGSSVSAGVGDFEVAKISLNTSSANNQIGSNGGTVELTGGGTVNVVTSGNNAYGVLAQSVGGGGGTIINSQSHQAAAGIEVGVQGSGMSVGQLGETDGGNVTLNLSAASGIRTSGTGAHGIVAQSVGGGGGIVGLPGTGTTLTVDGSKAPTSYGGTGAGGNVSITASGGIYTDGDGAIGILAQSVSGAGGLLLSDDGQTVYAGKAVTGGSASNMGSGTVEVTVNENSVISVNGTNGVGIFAQNAGSTNGATITVNGSVTLGATGNAGTAIWMDSDHSSTLTVSETGVVQSYEGTAILGTGGPLNVTSSGSIQGSATLNGGKMSNDGQYAAGAVFEGDLVNNGQFMLGGSEGFLSGLDRTRYATTTLTGSFTQTPAGTLQVGADFNVMESDALIINGPANLDGALLVAPRALLPNRELAVLSVNGTQSGALTASDSPIFDYATRQSGNTTHVRVARADFNASEMQLSANQRNVASHLQYGWDDGGASALASLYAQLDTASRAGADEYQQRVSDLSPGVTLAPAAQMQLGMARFTNSMMSCPTFGDAGALTTEQSCFWAEVSSRHTNQNGGDGTAGFSLDSVTYQFGGQREIAPHWFFGGSMAYQNSHLRGDDRRVGGSGDSGYAGIVLKREMGPWTFSGALGGGYGSFDLDRNLSIAGYDSQAKGKPDVYSFSARLRAARTFVQGDFYLKPYMDLTATYSRMPAYTESGDALRLKVDSSDQFVLGLAPAVEIGGRVELPRGAVLRPFAYAGVSLLSENGWKTKSRLDGSPDGVGSFSTRMPTDSVIGRIGAGLQVSKAAGIDFRLQYDGEFASRGNSHSGTLKVAVPF